MNSHTGLFLPFSFLFIGNCFQPLWLRVFSVLLPMLHWYFARHTLWCLSLVILFFIFHYSCLSMYFSGFCVVAFRHFLPTQKCVCIQILPVISFNYGSPPLSHFFRALACMLSRLFIEAGFEFHQFRASFFKTTVWWFVLANRKRFFFCFWIAICLFNYRWLQNLIS